MADKGIRLSEKHGVNPMVPKCFFCGEDKNEVVLFGRLPGDKEAPRGAVIDRQPCDRCAGYMKQGVMLVSVRDGEEGNNPHRTGRLSVVTEEGIRNVVPDAALVAHLIKTRFGYVPDSVWDMLGLSGPAPQ